MKKPHLFWILIDSARNYQTNEDDRGLPQAVLDFAKDSVYFKNVITSAPSTVQSISSMMTSSPSYLLSRSYNNYRGRLDCFDYFPEILRNNGYKTFGAIYFKHGREVMSEMFGHIHKKYYPKGLSHRKEVWQNKDVYNLFTNILDKYDWSEPTMCYLHYNVRIDTNISDIVDDTLSKIKEKGLMDNSVILINSDHGYPDPSKNYNFEEGLKQGWGHDKEMTNDNILTPLVLHYPRVQPKVEEDYIASIDIVPMLCNLLGVSASEKFHGVNHIPNLVPSSKRLIRTDNRYVGQLPSYNAYVQGEKKAIVYKDFNLDDSYTFYDLTNDPQEENGRYLSSEYQEFYERVLDNEKKLNQFHIDLLSAKWKAIGTKLKNKRLASVCVVLKSTPAFRQIVKQALQIVFEKATISFYDEIETTTMFDLKIFIIESEIPWEFKGLKSLGHKVNSEYVLYFDNNGQIFSSNVQFALYIRFFGKRWSIIKHDKLFIFDLIKRVLKQKLLKPIN